MANDIKNGGAKESARTSLPRVLGIWDVIGIVVGGVIGSGIFLVPKSIASAVQSPVLMLGVWVVGGLLSFFGALTFAELGAAMPEAGGRAATGLRWPKAPSMDIIELVNMNMKKLQRMNGTECRPRAPVAEGGPVGLFRRGEPTGLVPRGPGERGRLQAV